MNKIIVAIIGLLSLLMISGCAQELAPAPMEEPVEADVEEVTDAINAALDELGELDDLLDTSDLDDVEGELDLSDL